MTTRKCPPPNAMTSETITNTTCSTSVYVTVPEIPHGVFPGFSHEPQTGRKLPEVKGEILETKRLCSKSHVFRIIVLDNYVLAKTGCFPSGDLCINHRK